MICRGIYRRAIGLGLGIAVSIHVTSIGRADQSHAGEDSFWRDAAALLPGFSGTPQAPGPTDQDGQWGAVTAWPFIPVSAATLPNGKLLTYCGQERRNWPGTKTQTHTAVWDPATGTFDEDLFLDHEMFCAHLVMRTDGIVQTVGGRYTIEHSSVFDFRTNRWSRVDDMHDRRWYTTSVALANGDVFTVSGSGGENTAERYVRDDDRWDLLTGIDWSDVANALGFESRWWPYLFVAPDGRLFHFGPTETMHWVDPSGTGSRVSAGIAVPDNHYPKHAGVAMYDAGKILVAGGANTVWDKLSTTICYTVDLTTDPPAVALTAPMHHARRFASPVVLPGGEVLMIGGNTSGKKFSDEGSILTAEMWDPATGTWHELADMAVPRNYHSIGLLLPDGRAISGGGGYGSAGTESWHHQDVQLFTPPQLFAADGSPAGRPTISSAPDSVATGSVFRVDATPGMHRFAAIRMMATTHGWSSDQRRIDLPFAEDAAGEYRLVAHPNTNVMLPGYWMLFAIDAAGAYSEAAIFHVKEAGNGSEAGLLGEYFDGTDLLDKKLERIDHEVDFAWGDSSPAPDLVGDDTFSARWSGWIVPRYTESHTFYTISDDGVRLTVDGQLLIDNWTDHAPTEDQGSIVLTAGQPVPVTLEFYEEAGGAELTLSWSSARTPKQIVPEGALRHNNPSGAVGVAADDVFEVFVDGELVAIGTDWRKAYRAAFATNGKSTLAIRACNSDGGAAGVLAEFEIGGERIGTSAAWRVSTSAPAGWEQPAFDDSSWSAAADFGPADSQPWGTPLGMREGTPARWIWAADNTGVDEVFLRIAVGGPQLGTLADRSNNEGDPVSFSVPYSAPAGATLTFSATGLPSAIDIDPASGLISGSFDQEGEFDVTVTVTDGDGESDAESFRWSIGPAPNVPPTFVSLPDQAHTEGEIINLQLVADDPDGDDLYYLQTGLPPGLDLDEDTGLITGIAGTSGSYNVNCTVDDGRGGSDAMNFTWTVNPPLELSPTPTIVSEVAASIALSITSSGGTNPLYRWNFGDGTPDTPWSSSPDATHSYSAPGRYQITAAALDQSGVTVTVNLVQNVYGALTPNRPNASSPITTTGGGASLHVWNVNPDNDSVCVFDVGTSTKLAEIPVGAEPRSIAVAPDGRIWVTNKRSASISIIDPASFGVAQTIGLARGSRPHGLAFSPAGAVGFAVLEASGELLKIDADSGAVLGSVELGSWPRHLAVNDTGTKVYVSRYISSPVAGESGPAPDAVGGGGDVLEIDPLAMAVTGTIGLEQSTEPDSGGGGRGLPNYLGAAAISPDGSAAWVPSKQDNIGRGMLRDGRELTHENTVRAISSCIDLATGSENYTARVDHDDASVPSAAVYGPYGLYVFVAMEGSREVAVIDAYGADELFRFDVGRAPQGLALAADGRTLFVHNFLERSVSAFDLAALVENGDATVSPLGAHPTVASEALGSNILLGKQLFYDAKDPRIARDAYISCASCHNAGGHDGRVWDLTGFGEGVRNTIDLRGRAGTAHGPLHWSANFDEVQDFENQILSLNSGTGLIAPGAPHAPLAAPNAGRGGDLDALAAYVTSLAEFADSPERDPSGALTADALAGRQVFVEQSCAGCHSGNHFTDSGSGLHDVGTITSASGGRLDGYLIGLDTPTLRGLFDGAPFLHDGSAATLEDAVAAHQGISLDAGQMAQLVAYLKQIDGSEPSAPIPAAPGSGELPKSWGEWLAGGWGASASAAFGDDSESDSAVALLEYALGQSDTNGVRGSAGLRIVHSGSQVDAQLVRPIDITDLDYSIEVSADRTSWSSLAITPSFTDLGAGWGRWTFADLTSASGVPGTLGYARLKVTHAASATVALAPEQAWYQATVDEGFGTLGATVVKAHSFGGAVATSNATSITFAQDLTTAMPAGREYYVEITDGVREGWRFEIDEAASAGATVILDLGSPDNSDFTMPMPLAGSKAVIREHQTLGEVLSFPLFAGGVDPAVTDQAMLYENGTYTTCFPLDAGPGFRRWVDIADVTLEDASRRPIAPGRGLFIRRAIGAGAVTVSLSGEMRANDFRQRLTAGFNLVTGGYPVPTSPAMRSMTIDNGFLGALDPAIADQVHIWRSDSTPGQSGYYSYFLIDAGAGSGLQHWSGMDDPSLSSVDDGLIFPAGRAFFLKLGEEDHPGYRWSAPQ